MKCRLCSLLFYSTSLIAQHSVKWTNTLHQPPLFCTSLVKEEPVQSHLHKLVQLHGGERWLQFTLRYLFLCFLHPIETKLDCLIWTFPDSPRRQQVLFFEFLPYLWWEEESLTVWDLLQGRGWNLKASFSRGGAALLGCSRTSSWMGFVAVCHLGESVLKMEDCKATSCCHFQGKNAAFSALVLSRCPLHGLILCRQWT